MDPNEHYQTLLLNDAALHNHALTLWRQGDAEVIRLWLEQRIKATRARIERVLGTGAPEFWLAVQVLDTIEPDEVANEIAAYFKAERRNR